MRNGVLVFVLVVAAHTAAADDGNAKVQLALERLDAALATEAQRLGKANKAGEAEEVLALQKAVEQQIRPLNDPGRCSELRKRLFFEQLAFEWTRPLSPDRFIFEKLATPQGPAMKLKIIKPNATMSEGPVTMTGDDSAEIKWPSGFVWKIYAAGKERLLIDEFNGPLRTNDGIMLFR